jgi:hypothetical protein
MKIRILTFLCASMLLASSAPAALIAYWDQNSNQLPDASFGYAPSSFPQAADQGAGDLTIANFDATLKPNGAYDFIESFAGSTVNAQPAIVAGGSFSPEGSQNNGMSFILEVSTLGYEDILLSWAQRGTSTGFTSRELSYSTDGVNYTVFGTDSGALGATYLVKSFDLSSITAIDNKPTVYLSVKLAGATSGNGNNRFDNLTVEGTPAIPEPGTAVLAMLSLAAAGAVTMRSRLG